MGENKGPTSYEATITTDSQGVWIQINARQAPSGSGAVPSQPADGLVADRRSVETAGASQGTTTPSAVSGSNPVPRRTWVDSAGGYYSEDTDGRVYGLEPINSGEAFGRPPGSAFDADRRQAAGVTVEPRVMTVDGQYQGIVWIPSVTDPADVRWGAPPVPGSAPQPPAANGGSTDPREVALDLLHHVPLPNIVIQMNPSLGLVNLPGWFWVEGYDGQPFGASRTVAIPPAIGADVPFEVVPADDPGRQGSSFTVEVRVWPSRYDWDFGDGGSQTTHTLGRRYPDQSDIEHTYEFSSLRFADGFPVQLTVEFAAEFRVNGGPPEGLPSIRRTYESGYRVQEVQPVLVGR